MTKLGIRDSLGDLGLAQWLRAARAKSGLTQTELARLAGVSQALISRAEAGERDLPRKAIAAVARKLGVDPSDAIGHVGPKEVLDSIADAWNAYESLRTNFIGVLQDVKETSECLERHVAAIGSVVEVHDRQRLHYFASGEYRRVLDSRTRMDAEKTIANGRSFGAALHASSELRRSVEVLQQLYSLPDDERELIASVISKMRVRCIPAVAMADCTRTPE